VSQYQKGKNNQDFTEGTVSGSGIRWPYANCQSAPRPRQITMPAPDYSVIAGWMPFLPPNQHELNEK